MKAVFWLCTCAAVVKFSFPAPVEDEKQTAYHPLEKEQLDYLRSKRLHGNAHYKAPCQAAAASSGYYPDANYQNNFLPGQARYANSYGYAYPEFASLYRTDDPYNDEREIMSYPDGHYMHGVPSERFAKKLLPALLPSSLISPQALSSYLPINGANLGGFTGQIAQLGPSYGVFPNANVGGCNVPLLFSCTPSVVPGRISRAEPHVIYPPNIFGASPIDFRGVDDIQGIHPNRDENVQENTTPVKNPSAKLNENY